MRKFNQQISITVEVDDIASKLLSNLQGPHAQLLAETIVGNLKDNKHGINMLYNALHGYGVEIDAKVGDLISVKRDNLSIGYEGHDLWKKDNAPAPEFLLAQVIEVDPYSEYSVQVEFSIPKRQASPDSEGRFQPNDFISRKDWIHPRHIVGRLDKHNEADFLGLVPPMQSEPQLAVPE